MNLDTRDSHANQNQFNKEKLNAFYKAANQDVSLEDFEIDDDDYDEISYPITLEYLDELDDPREIVLPKSREKLTGIKLLRLSTEFYSQSFAEMSICIRCG